jgi:hypothetical protein
VIRRHARQGREFLPAQTAGAPLTACIGKAHLRQAAAARASHAARFPVMALHHALIMLRDLARTVPPKARPVSVASSYVCARRDARTVQV